MKLTVEPKIDPQGKITDTLSAFKPTDRERARLLELQKEYTTAQEIRDYAFREFGYRSLTQYRDDCLDRFINFIEDQTEGDPDQTWRANTVRPLTRNKVLEVAAYVTTRIMNPVVVAQNRDKQSDRVMSVVTENLMQWANEQSDYPMQFMYAVIGMLVSPVSYLYEGYAEYERDFKVIKEDGTYDVKKMVDEVFSGFQTQVVPCDEIFIMDAYEKNIQKQPALIWRRIISYEAAKIKYGNSPNFEYVKPGVRVFYANEDSIYEQQDENLTDRNVEEVIYFNRLADLELPLINGIPMSDPDRPLQRVDKRYPFAVGGYGLFDDGKFFYYKSMVDDLKPDQDQADTLINLILDGTYLKMMPPSVLYGGETIETGIMIPGSVSPLEQGSRLEQVQVAGDIALGFNTLQMIENNADESSKKDISQSRQQTAYEISRLEEDIKTKLGLFGKMIADLVLQFGRLRLTTLVEHITVAQLSELNTENNTIEYSKILIDNKKEEGKIKNKVIEFTEEVPEEGITDDEELKMSYELLAKEGNDLNSSTEIIKINPKLYRDMKFQVKINPDAIFRKTDATERAFALEMYDRAVNHPLANQESLYKMLIDQYKPGEAEKFMIEQQIPTQGIPGMPGAEETGMIPEMMAGGELPPTPKAPITPR